MLKDWHTFAHVKTCMATSSRPLAPTLAGEPADTFSYNAAPGFQRYVIGVRGYGTVLGIDCLDAAGAAVIGAIAMEPCDTLMFNVQKFSTYADAMTLRLFKNIATIAPAAVTGDALGADVRLSRLLHEAQHAEVVEHAHKNKLQTFRRVA